MKKISRNDPCPCGSGLKYKRCHSLQTAIPRLKSKTVEPVLFQQLPLHIQKHIISNEHKEQRHKALFGEIRPTISINHKGHKFVAVGNQLHYSKSWKTFHDFLFDYIKSCLGYEWWTAELEKNFSDRHPVIQWSQYLCDFQKKNLKNEDEISSAICTGPVGAYLSLAYDLYVLRHHSLLQARLVQRLKDKMQFQGARYEIYVTASFIRAGFEIAFEDETDRTKSHCEFVATHKATGNKYSVEAKSRHRPGLLGQNGIQKNNNEIALRIGSLLRNALKKEAYFKRIVFIDINMPPEEGISFSKSWFKSLSREIKKIEKEKINDKLSPPAYLVFTNHPNHYVGNEEPEPRKDFLITGIKMTHFKTASIEKAREADPAIFILWESINSHIRVPCNFED